MQSEEEAGKPAKRVNLVFSLPTALASGEAEAARTH